MKRFHFERIDSTNEAAKRLLASGEISDVALVTADEQTAGRGTCGRSWISPRGAGLYLSIVRRGAVEAIPPTTAYTLAAGVACAEVLADRSGLDVRLKPVNDLYVSGRKLGGILTEAWIEGPRIVALVTGIGINVGRAERGVPATSLEDEMPAEAFAALDATSLPGAIADAVERWHALVRSGDAPAVEAAFAGRRLA